MRPAQDLMRGNDPRVLLHDAQLMQRAGRFAEAEAAYTQLLTHWPDLPDSWYNLAFVQRHAGRFEAALASYQQALDRGVSQPEEVHLNRGVIYSDCLHQQAAAERELHSALALNPDYVPALLNLANLKEDFGKREEARAIYERILALEPRHYEALARYAGVTTARGPDDPLIVRMKHAIADEGTTAADRASLGFALGRALDACGAYEPAFDACSLANRASRESAAAPGALYGRGQHEAFVDRLIATFTSGSLAPAAAAARSPRPIFICGMFRSGSTLTEQVLAAHSHVTPGGEIGFLPAAVRKELAPFPASMTDIPAERLAALASRYTAMLSRLHPGADYVTDKRPDNFLYIGLIKRLFPDARIIHTTRSALDNCLSIYFLHLDHSMGYALDLMDTGHYYAQYRRLMTHWKSLYGADIFDFDYDRFVREPRPALQDLLAFCGLEWEEGCLSFQDVSNAVRTASVWQVREPLYRRSSGRWHNYAVQLASLREYLRTACPGLELD